MVIRQGEHYFQIVASDLHMGGGKMGAVEHLRLKNLDSGIVTEVRFRPDERVEAVDVERRRLDYLYQDGEFYVFMDPVSYEQASIHGDRLGDKIPFLKEDVEVTGLFLADTPLTLEFPEWVDLRVVTSPPPSHDQETSTQKEVTLENGMEILAPHFIKEGDMVRINLETRKYMERV